MARLSNKHQIIVDETTTTTDRSFVAHHHAPFLHNPIVIACVQCSFPHNYCAIPLLTKLLPDIRHRGGTAASVSVRQQEGLLRATWLIVEHLFARKGNTTLLSHFLHLSSQAPKTSSYPRILAGVSTATTAVIQEEMSRRSDTSIEVDILDAFPSCAHPMPPCTNYQPRARSRHHHHRARKRRESTLFKWDEVMEALDLVLHTCGREFYKRASSKNDASFETKETSCSSISLNLSTDRHSHQQRKSANKQYEAQQRNAKQI